MGVYRRSCKIEQTLYRQVISLIKKKYSIKIRMLAIVIMAACILGACWILWESQLSKRTFAVYIYMCGSNLETDGAAATENIGEMLGADIPDNVTVVIETGGSKRWRDYDIDNESISRYTIEDGGLVLQQTLENASMGESSTLEAFLNYCDNEFPADQSMLILWDHGGGSVGGVCYDENYENDSLSLTELSDALLKADTHYDFIGFDACLMATLDVAAAISPYADYMMASEEAEPSGGWDYAALVEGLKSENAIKDIGVAVCDAYLEKCKDGAELTATLSVIDLSKTDEVINETEGLAKKLSQKSEEKYGNFYIISAADSSAKFGGQSAFEGYSNLIDLYEFSKKYEDSEDNNLCHAIDDMVVYNVSRRENVRGISLYYPVMYRESQMGQYLSSCKIAAYKDYLKNLYDDIPKEVIRFEDDGSVADDGSFQISLSADSRKYVKSVEFVLLGFAEGETEYKQVTKVMGVDNDIFKDWENMEFHSNFRGIWVGLDGCPLNYSIVECNEDRIVFTAPVIVNKTRVTNLRFAFIMDDAYESGGYYTMLGLFDGIDDGGAVSREMGQLEEGDSVTVLSEHMNEGEYSVSIEKGDSVIIGENGGVISENPLRDAYYQYAYVVTDLFGNRYYSKPAVLEMEYTYDQLLENPLPDGEYAAKVIALGDAPEKLIYDGILDD